MEVVSSKMSGCSFRALSLSLTDAEFGRTCILSLARRHIPVQCSIAPPHLLLMHPSPMYIGFAILAQITVNWSHIGVTFSVQNLLKRME